MTMTTNTNPAHSKSSRVEHGAALWAFIFAAFHGVWGAGWYVGLEQEGARQAFQNTGFLIYDLVIAAMCLLGGLVALALVEPWGRRLSRRLISLLLWTGTGILALRASAGVIHGAYLTATQQLTISSRLLWEVWFSLGAVLFVLTLLRFRHAQRAIISPPSIE